jgi:ubiquinone/menaquinone biosynthesis C-methylase UbiE
MALFRKANVAREGQKMFKRWDEIAFSSKRAFDFRVRYLMTPLWKIAAKTPWFDQKIADRYYQDLRRIYGERLKNARVLDIGCGPGYSNRNFLETYQAKSYLGVDCSLGMVRDATKLYPESSFVCGNIYSLPFADKEFDVAHSTRLFHHLKPELRSEAVLEQLRVAKEAVIIEDLFGFESSIWRHPHRVYYTLVDGCYYRFTLREWHEMFSRLGVEVVQHIFTDEKMIQSRMVCWIINARRPGVGRQWTVVPQDGQFPLPAYQGGSDGETMVTVRFLLTDPHCRTSEHFARMIPMLRQKYDIRVETICMPNEKYETDEYFEKEWPMAPGLMVDDEIVAEGHNVPEYYLERVICRHLGLPTPKPHLKACYELFLATLVRINRYRKRWKARRLGIAYRCRECEWSNS